MRKFLLSISHKVIFQPSLVACLFIVCAFISNGAYAQTTSWVAPKSADQLKNPYKNSSTAIAEGKSLYKQLCAVCHGTKGKGDGVAGMTLKPRPVNFTKDIVQKQSDGALYWKLTEGRAPMAPYKAALTEQQRWQLVNYIRTFK